jgi:glutamyl-tRNA synthetase
MILGPDRSRLSKRHGATSVLAFRDEGFLAEAMVNYLARLGWAHGDQEVFTREELVRLFDLAQVGAAGAIFDRAKLEWLNGHWLRTLPPEEVAARWRPFLEATGLTPPPGAEGLAWLARAAVTLRERAATLREMAAQGRFYFKAPAEYDRQAAGKLLTPESLPRLERLVRRLQAEASWDEATLEGALRQLAAELGVKLVDLAQPVRLALTGQTASPPIFPIMALLGRDETLARLRALLARAPAAST